MASISPGLDVKAAALEPYPLLTNQGEPKKFLKTALALQGTVTPQVLPRVFVAMLYSAVVVMVADMFPHIQIPVTPFEYSGAVLGLLLVQRVNQGLDRWWEARKLWGGIVNQSRNLATIGYAYSDAKSELGSLFLRWVAAWPHVMRESLRKEIALKEVTALLGEEEANRIRSANHMPTYVGMQIAKKIRELRAHGLDNFAFQRTERERALLIDWIGACERIRNTPMPFVLAADTRRFIFMFLLLLPLALIDRAEYFTPLVVSLAAYPLFALDEIGAELQNPFSPRNLSHLPLSNICKMIEGNVMSLEEKSVRSEMHTERVERV